MTKGVTTYSATHTPTLKPPDRQVHTLGSEARKPTVRPRQNARTYPKKHARLIPTQADESHFFLFKLLNISYLAEHIINLALLGLSGSFQVRSASFFTEQAIQSSEALHHGPEAEKSRCFVISAQLESIVVIPPKDSANSLLSSPKVW